MSLSRIAHDGVLPVIVSRTRTSPPHARPALILGGGPGLGRLAEPAFLTAGCRKFVNSTLVQPLRFVPRGEVSVVRNSGGTVAAVAAIGRVAARAGEQIDSDFGRRAHGFEDIHEATHERGFFTQERGRATHGGHRV